MYLYHMILISNSCNNFKITINTVVYYVYNYYVILYLLLLGIIKYWSLILYI